MISQFDAAVAEVPTSVGPHIAYGRMRRWLGIAYVGVVVSACLIILTCGLGSKCFSPLSQPTASLAVDLSCALLLFSLCSLPFDVVGFNIERLYGRTKLTLSSFLVKQVCAAAKHGVVLLAMALLVALVWGHFGLAGLMIVSLLLSILLISSQLLFARFYGGVLLERATDAMTGSAFRGVKTVRLALTLSDERCFSGGIVGLPGFEKIVIPKWWLSDFSPEQLQAELARRNLIIASGGRSRGVLLAVGFTNIGLLLAAFLTVNQFALPLNSAAGLVTLSALFTIWSFVGLLTLPHFSHAGVYEADRLALESGIERDLLLQTISKIDAHLEDEHDRSRVVDTIFHPVPTIAHRRLALEGEEKRKLQGAWQAARYAVFLSVIGLGLLGRAVHCNAGKPDLWALLPAD